MSKKTFRFLFITILLLAGIIRFFKLGSVPVSLYWDETAMLIDAKVVAQTGHDMHGNHWFQTIFPSYGDYKLPIYIWLASISVKLFGVSEWALRLPSAVIGLGTVMIAGLVIRELLQLWSTSFQKKKSQKNLTKTKLTHQTIQLSTMLIVGLSPWSIMFSRTAFEGHLAQLLVGISVYFLVQAYQLSSAQLLTRKKSLFLGLAISVGALATYAYFSVRFVWPIILLGLSGINLLKNFPLKQLTTSSQESKHTKTHKNKPSWINEISNFAIPFLRQLTVNLFVPLILFFLLLIPMFRSPLYQANNTLRLSTTSVLNNFDYALISNKYRELAGNKVWDRLFFHRHYLLIRELIKNYTDHVNFNFLFMSGDDNLRHGTSKHGLFLITCLPIFVYGLYQLAQKNWPILTLLIIWWIAALLPASVPETTPHALRSLNALIPLSIIIGTGLGHLIGYLSLYWQKTNIKILTFLLGSLFLINSVQFLNHYFAHYPAESSYEWQDGYRQLYQLISKEKESVRTVWVAPFESRFYLWALAYGDYSGKDIQAMPKTDYHVTQLDNISFEPFDWSSLETLDHKILVVGETQNMLDQIQNHSLKPNWTQEIKSADGESRFLVIHYGN